MKKIIFTLFIALFFINKIYGQKDEKKINYNLRINSYYDFQVKRDNNYKTFQVAPVFSIDYKNNNFYFGPLYVYFFQPNPIASEIFAPNSFGLNLGYRYYSKELMNNFRLFGQFNYSIFQVKYKDYQLGPPFQTDHKRVIAENTIALGLDFRIIKKFHLSFSFGFGSYDPFFLLINEFTFTSNLGIEYKF